MLKLDNCTRSHLRWQVSEISIYIYIYILEDMGCTDANWFIYKRTSSDSRCVHLRLESPSNILYSFSTIFTLLSVDVILWWTNEEQNLTDILPTQTNRLLDWRLMYYESCFCGGLQISVNGLVVSNDILTPCSFFF